MSSLPPVGAPGASSGLGAASAQELSDRFLTMLTAQMSNQDPLNPLDNSEVTSQLAQISTVTGVNQLNSTMEWLGYSMASLQSTQAASLIGREVMVPGDSLTLADGVAKGGYNLPLAVESAQLVIKNADGEDVARIDLDDVEAGTHTFEWDGKTMDGDTAPDGKYEFSINVQQGDQVGTALALSVSTVASMRPYAGGTAVIDKAGASINLSDVYQVW